MQQHIENIQNIVGREYVLLNINDKEAYETPWRGDKGKAFCVICPGNSEETSQVLAYCTKHNIPLVVQAGNTGLVGASTPDDSNTQVVISFKRLNSIKDINILNRSMYVQAGARLSQINKSLEEIGYFFPIDLSADPCIGGMAATNTGGSRFLKYGGVRENLLGLKVILPNEQGTIINLNHNLHKNNTGLDLKQLFIGTGCTNGIITECVIKISPIPKQIATALIIPKDFESIPLILEQIKAKVGDQLSAFEGMSRNALEAVFQHNQTVKNGFGKQLPFYCCLIEISKEWEKRPNEDDLDNILQIILEEIMQNNPELFDDVLFGHSQDHWKLRHAVSESVQKSGKLISFDISFAIDQAMTFRENIEQELLEQFPDIKLCDFGHIGDGAMHFNLIINPQDKRLSDIYFIANLREWVLDKVVYEYKGSFSAEHGIGPLNQHAYEKYISSEIKTLSAHIKDLCSEA